MSERYDATVSAWEKAARDDEKRSAYIHPDGADAAAYDASGQRAAAEVRSLCIDGDHVLDFGCGDGRVLRHVRDLAFGYDTSPAMRAAARLACPKAIIIDALEELAGGTLDLVYSHAVFIHHTYADGARMLVELARLTRVAGIVAVQIPLYDVAREPESWTGVGVWTQRQLEGAAAAANLLPVTLFANRGAFAYSAVGRNHYRLQVLRKAG